MKDRFGVSWQIVPPIVNEIMEGKDEAKAERMLQALYQTQKIDIAALERAANSN